MKNFTLVFLAIVALCAFSFAQGPAYPYSVELNFTASTGTITGYNMYRAPFTTSCGTFAKVNSAPFTGTSYVDNNPAQGGYCYAATAVGAQGESGLSNTVSNIQIPPPPPTNLGAATAKAVPGTEKFTWAQSTGKNLKKNALICDSKQVFMSAKPVTSTNVTLKKGTHSCIVDVYDTAN